VCVCVRIIYIYDDVCSTCSVAAAGQLASARILWTGTIWSELEGVKQKTHKHTHIYIYIYTCECDVSVERENCEKIITSISIIKHTFYIVSIIIVEDAYVSVHIVIVFLSSCSSII